MMPDYSPLAKILIKSYKKAKEEIAIKSLIEHFEVAYNNGIKDCKEQIWNLLYIQDR
jgi:hypothetical protein